MRIGQDFDVHALMDGRRLMLGGLEIPYERGLEGHSDGDVLLHAVAGALLGAMGEGDLGQHFPSSNAELRGIASSRILEQVEEKMRVSGYRLANLDATLIAQAPRLAPYQPKMRANLATLLNAPLERISLKVTSTDGLGTIGRGEGIACLAVVLLDEQGQER